MFSTTVKPDFDRARAEHMTECCLDAAVHFHNLHFPLGISVILYAKHVIPDCHLTFSSFLVDSSSPCFWGKRKPEENCITPEPEHHQRKCGDGRCI
jgi:hypothetical protein